MLNLHRDKKIVRRKPGRDGKILCDHRQDGNDEVHRLLSEMKEKRKEKKQHDLQSAVVLYRFHDLCYFYHQ